MIGNLNASVMPDVENMHASEPEVIIIIKSILC